MGRLKAFDPDDALDRAMRTFWQHGYDATSVDDIVVSTGVPVHCLPTDPRQKASDFEVGQFVSMGVEGGTSFEEVSA